MVADEMRQSSVVIGEGREDVNTIADALGQISKAVSEAATRSGEIFHGADTHSLNAQSMVAAIEEIAKVASGNGRSVFELGDTLTAQTATLHDIYASSEAVARLASELETTLTIFETGALEPTLMPSVQVPQATTVRPLAQPLAPPERYEWKAPISSAPAAASVDAPSRRDAERW